MKKRIALICLLFGFYGIGKAQTVSHSYVAPSSVSIDGAGNYGYSLPPVTFSQSDFTDGCAITDVNVIISWAKTAGTCSNPTGGFSSHQETSFEIVGPSGTEILAIPGTWSGGATTTTVITTFSDGNVIPSGTPVTGTFGPNNGVLGNYNGTTPFGTWNLNAGDNNAVAPLCINYYTVEITTAPDNTAPSLTVSPDITLNADNGSCGTTVTWTPPTASDLCGATVTQTAGPTSGSTFNVGTTTVTYQAADPYGNVTTQSFDVTIVDNQNPSIVCPGTVFAGCNPVVNYPLPTATDNCSGVVINLTSGPASGGTFTPGTTTVTYEAQDASGNTTPCSFDVVVDTESTDPTSITASASTVCSGDPVTLTVNGGSLGTNAQWYWYVGSCGGQLVAAGSTVTVNPLTTTNYYVRAEGPCNTTACVSVPVNVIASPTVGFSGITSPSACGAADATITAIASGGAPPYIYTWSNGSVGPTVSGLTAGPYEVLVTDASGCQDFSSVSLNDPGASQVTLTDSDPDNEICQGESVTFTASGAFQYQYYVNGVPVTTQNPWVTTSLQDGDIINVTGTDFNFCTFTTPAVNFTVLDNPVIDETVTDPSACALSDGLITTSVSGGLPPYGYDWSNAETTPNISGLPAGPYVLTVTDDNGCFSTETYALSDPGASPVTLASSEDPNNEICAGESVTFTASGSVDYQFFVDGQPVSTTNPFVTNTLVDGESVVATGTDANNCTATSNIIIPTVNPGPIVSLIVDDADTTICIGESLSFFASGGLTYEFFVDGVSQGAASPTSLFVTSSLTDGQAVTVVATDANLCGVESDTIFVTVNPSPTVSIASTSDPTSCGATDGSIIASATGGTPSYTYNWSNGAVGDTISSLNAGSYYVEVTDDAGCTAATSASLSDIGSSPVTLTTTSQNDTICGGETVTFTGSGASTYVFFVNGIQVSTSNPYVTDTLMDGDIIAVMGLDTQLCAATSAPEVFTVHPEIQIGIVSSINPSACGALDGVANTITIGGVPAYTYSWTDPSNQTTPIAVGLGAGAYSVTVTDANGCQSSDGVSLSDPGGFAVSLTASPSGLTICEGTEIEFTASSNGSATFEFFVDGVSVGSTNPYLNSTLMDGQSVAVVGVDTSNCTATSPSSTYTVLPVPSVTLTLPAFACSSVDTVPFVGGFPLGGDYTVVYDNYPIVGDLFFPSLAGAGAINVDYTYTAANGCSATASGDYNVLQAPIVDLGSDTTVCGITLDAGSGYDSYAWTPTGDSTSTIFVDVTGVYEVTVTDANGCVETDAIGITVNPIPSPAITPGPVVEFCIGNYATLSAQPGFTIYDWSTGSTVDTTFVTASDTVTLTVTNQYGCTGTAQVVAIMNEPQPGAVITWDGPLEFCVGDDVTLNAGPGYASYLWNTGSTTQTINAIQTGEYWVIVLDGNGCIDSSMVADPVDVTVWDPEPVIDINGDSLTISNASDFVSYQWYLNGSPIAGATGSTYDIAETGSGNYKVCVVDMNGCEGCSFVYEMTCCVGIEEANFDGNVAVYPNPNNGRFTLEVEMARKMDMTVGLYDMVGKEVWLDQDLGEVSNLRKQYDLTALPDGVYFLRIYADDQMTVQKLVKQK
ncbi:MAG: HYR domain-containing protein [Flavobacteriales bacterium]|nr:HYR domain-containing protein [Flavobacteriales bacterium]